MCFVSTDLKKDLQIAKQKFPENTIVRDYVLPDYSTIKRGYTKPVEKTGSKPVENEQVIVNIINSEKIINIVDVSQTNKL